MEPNVLVSFGKFFWIEAPNPPVDGFGTATLEDFWGNLQFDLVVGRNGLWLAADGMSDNDLAIAFRCLCGLEINAIAGGGNVVGKLEKRGLGGFSFPIQSSCDAAVWLLG